MPDRACLKGTGVQGRQVRPALRQDRPVRAHQPDLLHLRHQRRTQTPQREGMDLQRLRHRPRPGHQRSDQDGRRTGGIGLRSAGKTRSDPGTARRNRKPRIPDRKPCRVAAQPPVREGQNPRPSGRGACQNRRLQRVFYISALFSIRYCENSRRFYDRKRAEGKRHVRAVLALARHRVNVLWALLRDGRCYEPTPPPPLVA